MNRNIRLLIEDIYYPIMRYKQTLLNRNNEWKKQNKKEVLLLYRYMLKNIPKMQNSYLEEKWAYEKIKFNFREGSREEDFEVINNLKNVCYVIFEKINNGVYPPFPKFKA